MTFNIYKYLTRLSTTIRGHIDDADDIADSLSETQFKSKTWLVEHLMLHYPPNPHILILGGWYGSYLVPLLNEHIKPCKITLTDIDPRVVDVARSLHNDTNVEFDILNADQPIRKFDCDVLINTSCEHMHTIGDAVVTNPNCLYVLQSCDNNNDPGHINTSQDTDTFVKKTELTNILYKGRLGYGYKNRFMVIGHK
jgi:hypothetical protein